MDSPVVAGSFNVTTDAFRFSVRADADGQAAGFQFSIPEDAESSFATRCEDDAGLHLIVRPRVVNGTLTQWGFLLFDLQPTPVLAYMFGSGAGTLTRTGTALPASLDEQRASIANYVHEPSRLEVRNGEPVAALLFAVGEAETALDVELAFGIDSNYASNCEKPGRPHDGMRHGVAPVGNASAVWWAREWTTHIVGGPVQEFASSTMATWQSQDVPTQDLHHLQAASPALSGWGFGRVLTVSSAFTAWDAEFVFHGERHTRQGTYVATTDGSFDLDAVGDGDGGLQASQSVAWTDVGVNVVANQTQVIELLQLSAPLQQITGLQTIGFSCGYYTLESFTAASQCGPAAQTAPPPGGFGVW